MYTLYTNYHYSCTKSTQGEGVQKMPISKVRTLWVAPYLVANWTRSVNCYVCFFLGVFKELQRPEENNLQ